MAQQVIPAAQLVPRYHTIGRCNNYVMLQTNVPVVYLQQFWQTVHKVPNTKDTIIFKLDTQEITYTVDMFRAILKLPVETPDNPFVAPITIKVIESFMNKVGYQRVVDKVSAFYTKNLAQPWQTMFKVFNRCLTTRTSGHDQTKINILQLFHVVINRTNVDYAALLWWDFMNNVFQNKEAIQYPRFIMLMIVDLMKKFLDIPQRVDEDYHSIKDDTPLVSVYTIGNVLVRGMLISNEFLTKEIRATDDFKEYETVFVRVDVPINQPQPGKKRKQTARESSSPLKSLEITIRQKQVVEGEKDDDAYKDSKYIHLPEDSQEVDRVIHEIVPQLAERATDDLIENNLKPSITATIIEDHDAFHSEVPDLVSQEFNAQAPKIIEEVFNNYVQSNVNQIHPTTTTSTETTSSADLQQQLYLKMKRSLQDQANDLVLWKVLKRKFEKSSTSNTSCRDDDIHSQRHDDHQEDDAPPKGEKRVKRHKASKSLKSARGSSSKHSAKDSTTYVSKQQQQQQEWDAWVEETVIDDDEVIPEDETPELITELQNVDKHVLIIFDRARMEATLNDMLSNQFKNAEEYAYHLEQATTFKENQIV
ncbi:hypothetical protein Tco_0257232 [Tanacetum coccineum]